MKGTIETLASKKKLKKLLKKLKKKLKS